MCSILISDDPLLMTTRCLGIHPKLSVHFISRHCKWWKGRARYSASVLERETTSCFLLRHETREVPNRKQKPGIAEVTTSPGIASPPCSHGWPTVLVLFAWDALGGCLYGHAALPSYDFGWPRTGLSSAMSLDNLDPLCSSSGISSSSAWALGLVWSGSGLLSSLTPQLY